MTLFQHTLGQLLRGEKTETSHLALPLADGEHIVGREMIQYPSGIKSVMRGTAKGWTVKWQVGKDYAIQPARGVASIGRYRLVDIWRQDVRELTLGQVDDEGFGSWSEFWFTWSKMHDPKLSASTFHENGWWNSALKVKEYLSYRPDERYQAWRMEIEVLYETIDWDAPAVQALNINPYADLKQRLTAQEWRELYLGKWMPPE